MMCVIQLCVIVYTQLMASRFFILQCTYLMFEHACIYLPCTSHRILQSKVKTPMPVCRPWIRYTCISCYILGYTGISCDIPFHTVLCFWHLNFVCFWCWNMHTFLPMHNASHPAVKDEKSTVQTMHRIYFYMLVCIGLVMLCHTVTRHLLLWIRPGGLKFLRQGLKQECGRNQDVMTRSRHRHSLKHVESPPFIFIFMVTNHKLQGEDMGPFENMSR